MYKDIRMRHLDDWLYSYMQFTEETEPHPQYRKWCAISAIATVMQRRCYYNNLDGLVYPNFYIVLVGPSSARKNTAINKSVGLLRMSGLKLNLAPAATTREKLIEVIYGFGQQEIVGTGRTIEHTSATVIARELSVFIGQRNFLLINDLTDWYDCPEVWDYLTKTQGMYVLNNMWINLLGGITPEMIQAVLPMEAIVGGLTQRMVMVYAPGRHKAVPFPYVDKELEDLLAKDLNHIGNIYGEYKPTTEFLEKYGVWYMSQNGADPSVFNRFDGYVGRRQILIQKLSMISCASRTDKMILEDRDFDRALSILEEVEVLMPNVFQGVGRSPISGTMHKVLVALSYKRNISKGELMGLFHNDVNLDEMEMILTMLDMEGKIDRVIGGQQEMIRYKG